MRKYVLAMVGLVLVCLLAALGTASASPDTVTVDSTTDVSDGDTSSISALKADPGTDGVISLREAIEAAENTAGSDTIEFNIPTTDAGYEVSGVSGTWTISLTSVLPYLTDGGTIISGSTQAEYQGDPNPDGPEIEISGASMGFESCLTIRSAGNVIEGLVINSCGYHGICIYATSATTNTVSGNYIGTDATGTLDRGNACNGVYIGTDASNNTVGGDTEGQRNVISGNGADGVRIMDGNGNTISGNYIGVDASGSSVLANQNGIGISDDAANNVVGGDSEGQRNIISGNEYGGVYLVGSPVMSNTIAGNYIGTDVSGTLDSGNGEDGVSISSGAHNNTIGPNNLIAHNDDYGVRVDGSGTTGNTITQNATHSNGLLGINNWDGGNTELPPPVVCGASCAAITGTAPPNALVEVFTGPDNEGKTYLSTTSADGGGDWGVVGPFTLDTYVTATATDGSGNTSEFSAEAAGVCHQVFVPLTMKMY
jgi:hypothetical protein